MTHFRTTIAIAIVMGLTACGGMLVPGCLHKTSPEVISSSVQFSLLGRMYGEYLANHNGLAPPDEESFKKFLKSREDRLATAGTSQVVDLLVSPRDGQPLVVLYGKQSATEGPGGLPWAAYEQTGLAGRRYAIGARGTVEEMDQEHFAQVFPGRSP